MPVSQTIRSAGSAKLRSRMPVASKCQLWASSFGKIFLRSRARATAPSASSTRAQTHRAAKASQPSSKKPPMAKPRFWMVKIIQKWFLSGGLCRTHWSQYSILRQRVQIFFAAVQGQWSRSKGHTCEKENKLLRIRVDNSRLPRYTVCQKVRFRAGCNSPPAV